LLELFNILSEKLEIEKTQKEFHPHLTVANKIQKNKTKELMKEFGNGFEKIEFEIKEIYLISRNGDEPFEIIKSIPIGSSEN
jgi:2'-5' RNA ligase